MASPVTVDALALVRIAKLPQHSTGFLIGIDNHITGAYPFPATGDGSNDAKAHTAYSDLMLKHLREVNIDAQNVGFFITTGMGSFINQQFIENQLHYQKAADDNKFALVFDTVRSSTEALSLKAYTLSSAFLEAHKDGKFTTESLQKFKLRYQDILIEHPVSIHNSHLVTSYLHTVSEATRLEEENAANGDSKDGSLQKERLSDVDWAKLERTLDGTTSEFHLDPLLHMTGDTYLERTTNGVLDQLDLHHVEQNNHQYWQRALGREQAKITAWQQKRKAENATRVASKQPPLDENEWQRLFKLPQEPSRLESLLIGRQIEQYARQVDAFTATSSTKMFAAREVL